jgi:hypothetical protein
VAIVHKLRIGPPKHDLLTMVGDRERHLVVIAVVGGRMRELLAH